MPKEFLASNVSECPHKYNLCYCINTEDYIMMLMLAEILYFEIFVQPEQIFTVSIAQQGNEEQKDLRC